MNNKLAILMLFLSSAVFAVPTSIQVNQGSASAVLRSLDAQIHNQTQSVRAKVFLPKTDSQLFAKLHHVNFVLKKVIIEGSNINITKNPTLSNQSLMKIFQPFYGKKISVAKLQALVNAGTDKFLAKGFILSHLYLPQQKIDKGVVTVKVVEGFVRSYKLKNPVGENSSLIKEIMQPVLNARPLKSVQLERALLLVNKIPGVTVKGVLNPDKYESGAASLTLLNQQKSSHLVARVHNFGTKLQGREQVLLGASAYSDVSGGELSAWIGHSLESNRSKSLIVSHSSILGEKAGILSVTASIAKSRPNYALAGLTIVNDDSRAASLTFKYTYPLYISRNYSNYIDLSLAGYDAEMSDVNFGSIVYHDEIRSIRLGSTSEIRDNWGGNSQIIMSVSHGMNALGANAKLPSRQNGALDYWKVNASINRIQPIYNGMNWNLKLTGQYSSNDLLASEEFLIGGHGYDGGELSGDTGFSIYNEFAKRWYVRKNDQAPMTVEGYIFHYLGHVKNSSTVNQVDDDGLSSVGLGARLWLSNSVHADLFVAKPLNHVIALEGNKNPRLFASLTFENYLH